MALALALPRELPRTPYKRSSKNATSTPLLDIALYALRIPTVMNFQESDMGELLRIPPRVLQDSLIAMTRDLESRGSLSRMLLPLAPGRWDFPTALRSYLGNKL